MITLAKKKEAVSHRTSTDGYGVKTACGLRVREVKGKVKTTWAGVKCLRCLKVKEAEAKAKAAKKGRK